MRKRLVIAILIGVSVLTPAGFAAWYESTADIGFAAVTPYAHDFSGALPSENAPTIPVTHTTTAVTTAAVSSETTAALPEPTQTTAGTTEQPTETTAFEVHYPLDLNAATFEELCTLPDIGTVTAQAILDERERLGGFTNRAQLRNVPGIGEKRFAGIAELVYIENEQPLPTDPPEEMTESAPVPEPEPSAPEPSAPEPEPPTSAFINLNTATLDDLMRLPGCDEETANAILELRGQIGIFHNPLEVTMVISQDLYNAWEPYLAVDDTGSTQLPMDTLPAE